MNLGKVEKSLLKEIADIEKIPQGAYNIRDNGKLAGRNTTANIDIQTKADKPGIDIFIKSATKGERVDIPVILTETGLNDLVYNDFYVEDGADVTIVAGCGIHNAGGLKSEHDGIHAFHIGKNAKVLYIEKHYGEGEGTGERILNPTTIVEIDENGSMTMETAQIKGVDSAVRKRVQRSKTAQLSLFTKKSLHTENNMPKRNSTLRSTAKIRARTSCREQSQKTIRIRNTSLV